MATTIYPTVPVAQPEAEAWPVNDDPISIQADEMFARQLDTGFTLLNRHMSFECMEPIRWRRKFAITLKLWEMRSHELARVQLDKWHKRDVEVSFEIRP